MKLGDALLFGTALAPDNQQLVRNAKYYSSSADKKAFSTPPGDGYLEVVYLEPD